MMSFPDIHKIILRSTYNVLPISTAMGSILTSTSLQYSVHIPERCPYLAAGVEAPSVLASKGVITEVVQSNS